ncbi:hypothetical protein EON71_00400 [bacterium]|nr:MAG: hypothetical protein EON71_00400 [bacterium]
MSVEKTKKRSLGTSDIITIEEDEKKEKSIDRGEMYQELEDIKEGSDDVWTLIVDNRELFDEKKLYDKLNKNQNIIIKKKQLTIGDYIWVKNSKVWMVIEKKMQDDYENSLRDNRYSDQIVRMCKLPDLDISKIFYCIVGKKDKKKYSDEEKSILNKKITSTITHLSMSTPIHGIFIENDDAFYAWLAKIYEYMPEKEDSSVGKEYTALSHHTLKKRKIENKSDMLRATLCQVNGVSQSKASAICNTYTSIRELIYAYDNTTEQKKPFMLSDIQSAKTKIGKKTSCKILELL